jgi:hypothetical protein
LVVVGPAPAARRGQGGAGVDRRRSAVAERVEAVCSIAWTAIAWSETACGIIPGLVRDRPE